MVRSVGQDGHVGDFEFSRDLYRGAAPDYERFRLPYPRALVDDMLRRTAATGSGVLLDLACGTGQVAFALAGSFGEVWAVDQEPDMIRVVRKKAEDARVGNIRCLVSAAEDLELPADSCELVTIGNAFHRLRREVVALSALGWLQPGRCLALLWGGTPWRGEAPWQKTMSATLDRWMSKMRAQARIPAGLEQMRRKRPDVVVLRECGFEVVGAYEFPTEHEWTLETLVGFVYSTSFLSREVLGGLIEDFEADLRRELGAAAPMKQRIRFTYELARRLA